MTLKDICFQGLVSLKSNHEQAIERLETCKANKEECLKQGISRYEESYVDAIAFWEYQATTSLNQYNQALKIYEESFSGE